MAGNDNRSRDISSNSKKNKVPRRMRKRREIRVLGVIFDTLLLVHE